MTRTRLIQPSTRPGRSPVVVSQARRARCPDCPDGMLLVIPAGTGTTEALTEHWLKEHDG